MKQPEHFAEPTSQSDVVISKEAVELRPIPGNEDMGRRRGQRKGWLHKRSGTWLLTYRDYTKTPPRVTESIGPCSGPGALTKKQAERFAWDHFLAPLDNSVRTPWSTLTLGQFWERFYKSHLEKKRKFATQSQYKSLWKLWIEPELGSVRLFELKPLQIDAALDAAIAKEKGSSTVKHIRKVISAIVEYARTLQMFTGDNPAQAIEAPETTAMRKKRAMTVEQCREWFAIAKDIPRDPKDAQSVPRPLRTMSLLGIACSVGTSEQLGFKWEHLNLSDEAVLVDGEVLEPKCASIREHSYHGRKGTLKHGHRRRDVPLPQILVDQLTELRKAALYDGPDDPVFAGAAGKPIWADTLQARTLKPLAKTLGLDWISWHIFRHTCATLTKTFGMSEPDRQALMGHAPRTMTERYTHEDFERMRAIIEKVATEVTMEPKKKADSDSQPTRDAQLAESA